MVKPAGPCLDLIRRAKERFGSPLGAYQVSGEYAMIKAAAERGMLNEQRAMWESVTAIRRARGANKFPYVSPPPAPLMVRSQTTTPPPAAAADAPTHPPPPPPTTR